MFEAQPRTFYSLEICKFLIKLYNMLYNIQCSHRLIDISLSDGV